MAAIRLRDGRHGPQRDYCQEHDHSRSFEHVFSLPRASLSRPCRHAKLTREYMLTADVAG
jgi:hypothetical protein